MCCSEPIDGMLGSSLLAPPHKPVVQQSHTEGLQERGGFGHLPRWGKEQGAVRGWGWSSALGGEALKCPSAPGPHLAWLLRAWGSSLAQLQPAAQSAGKWPRSQQMLSMHLLPSRRVVLPGRKRHFEVPHPLGQELSWAFPPQPSAV